MPRWESHLGLPWLRVHLGNLGFLLLYTLLCSQKTTKAEGEWWGSGLPCSELAAPDMRPAWIEN